MQNIIKILKEKGAMLSSDLSIELQNTLGIYSDAARQKIRRAISAPNSLIRYILDLNFPHNTRFIYLKDDEKDEIFFQNLYEALNKTGSSYAHALNTLIAKNGIIQKDRFRILSGSPDKITGHLSYKNILQRLLETDICREVEYNGESHIFLMDNYNTSVEYAYAQNKVEELLIPAVKDWLKRMCLVSFNAVDGKNEFGSFGWDITAPSYVSPLRNGKKPGFMVADIIFNQIDENCLKYFLHKVKILKSQKGIYPFMSILVARFFTPEAYKLGKNNGLILTTPEILFGVETSKALNELLSCLSHAGSVAANDLNKFMDLYDKLSTIKGASTNLQGDLLEFITAHCVKQIIGGSIDIGKKISYSGESRHKEIDVMLVTNTSELYFYECKGYNQNNWVKKEEIENWLEKIKYIRKWIKEDRKDFKDRQIFFEFITMSDFQPEAKNLLDQEIAKVIKYSISYKNGKEFVNYIRDKNISDKTKIIETLKQHYLNLPL